MAALMISSDRCKPFFVKGSPTPLSPRDRAHIMEQQEQEPHTLIFKREE